MLVSRANGTFVILRTFGDGAGVVAGDRWKAYNWWRRVARPRPAGAMDGTTGFGMHSPLQTLGDGGADLIALLRGDRLGWWQPGSRRSWATQPARLVPGPGQQLVQQRVVHQRPQRPPRRDRSRRLARRDLHRTRQDPRVLACRSLHNRSPPEEPGHIPARGPITLSNQLPHLRKYLRPVNLRWDIGFLAGWVLPGGDDVASSRCTTDSWVPQLCGAIVGKSGV